MECVSDDVACATCGTEIYRGPENDDRECFACFRMREAVKGSFYFRVDDHENMGSERKDETQGHIITLNNVAVEAGRDQRGKMRYIHRPATVADFPNRRAFLDEAKRQGLSPGDGGRYRTAGQRG